MAGAWMPAPLSCHSRLTPVFQRGVSRKRRKGFHLLVWQPLSGPRSTHPICEWLIMSQTFNMFICMTYLGASSCIAPIASILKFAQLITFLSIRDLNLVSHVELLTLGFRQNPNLANGLITRRHL
jgi:hypothetical protein